MNWHTKLCNSNVPLLLLVAVNAALIFYIFTGGSAAALSNDIGRPIWKTFDRDSPLQEVGERGDRAWQDLTPTRGGFLWVETDVENAKEGHKKEEEWGISMFHGIHCLQMLRGAFQQMLVHKNETASEAHQDLRTTATKRSSNHHSGADAVHIGHCLGYLADYLTCHADSTLEPPVREYSQDGRLSSSVDGLGYQHQCRDTNFLWKIARASESQTAQRWSWYPGQKVEDLLAERNP